MAEEISPATVFRLQFISPPTQLVLLATPSESPTDQPTNERSSRAAREEPSHHHAHQTRSRRGLLASRRIHDTDHRGARRAPFWVSHGIQIERVQLRRCRFRRLLAGLHREDDETRLFQALRSELVIRRLACIRRRPRLTAFNRFPPASFSVRAISAWITSIKSPGETPSTL